MLPYFPTLIHDCRVIYRLAVTSALHSPALQVIALTRLTKTHENSISSLSKKLASYDDD